MRLAADAGPDGGRGGASADEVWLKGGGRLVGDVIAKSATDRRARGRAGHASRCRCRASTASSAAPSRSPSTASAPRRSPRGTWPAGLALAELGRAEGPAHAVARGVAPRARGRSGERGRRTRRSATSCTRAGGWTSRSAQRARGLVEYDGVWMTPGRAGGLVSEQAAEAGARRQAARSRTAQRQEAEARVREAEARARTAEADAARAEADALRRRRHPAGSASAATASAAYGVRRVRRRRYGVGRARASGRLDPDPPGRPRRCTATGLRPHVAADAPAARPPTRAARPS